jgi:hypothetical protein
MQTKALIVVVVLSLTGVAFLNYPALTDVLSDVSSVK